VDEPEYKSSHRANSEENNSKEGPVHGQHRSRQKLRFAKIGSVAAPLW